LRFIPLALAAALAGCGNNNVLTFEGGTDAAGDGLACAPADVSTFAPIAMHPPNPPMAKKCSTQEILDYIACDVGQDTTKCAEFTSGQPDAPCAACIESQKSDPTWGVIVFDGTTSIVNIEGCVDNVLGQVSAEPNSCGELLHASYECQNTACSACTGSQFDPCDLLAVSGGCASYDQAVQSPTGPCASLLTDASAAQMCFPLDCPADASTCSVQESDWLTRIIGFMCGNGS
jgi:hypothetical protein